MAVPDAEDVRDVRLELLDQSYLTYAVPLNTELDAEKALKKSGSIRRSIFDGIEQRELLFFDETIDIYLALRAPYQDEDVFRKSLGRLFINIEAQVINSNGSERDPSPASDVIYNREVSEIEKPILVYSEEDAATNGEDSESTGKHPRSIYAVWKVPMFLARPRMRLQAPSVVIYGNASLRPSSEALQSPNNGYLPSRMPSGQNLLEAFVNDPALKGIRPRLSALRVSRVAPVTHLHAQPRPLKGLHSLKFKIYPVMHARVRFSRPNTTPPSQAVIALLEVDFTPFSDCETRLDKITLSVTDGTVENLTDQDDLHLPLSCVSHDHITFLYRLAPSRLDTTAKDPNRDLEIAIEATALVRPEAGSGLCTPRLRMAWSTPLDFTLPLNPGFGQLVTQPIRRAHRPSQLSIGGDGVDTDAHSLVAPSVRRPDSIPSLEAAAAHNVAAAAAQAALPEFGITMTFTGPAGPIHVGDEFAWTVFVVNRSHPADSATPTTGPSAENPVASSSATLRSSQSIAAGPAAPGAAARKLALIAIPKRRGNDVRMVRSHSASGARLQDPSVADAVLDENVVHAMQRGSAVDDTDLLCLSADVRVGPLAPNACAVVELRFLALKAGIVGVEALRVMDLASQEHADLRELPTVFVQNREKEFDS